jgi:16S rRNA (cytidine1402-2'-O)-methyltransferase
MTAELGSAPICQWYNNRRSFMPGTLFVVATPIGNLEDITVRALRVLREVAVIAAEDTRRTAKLLARHGITTPTTSLHEHNERRKAGAIVARLQAGESVALVSDAGTPLISDPGGQLVADAIDAGIAVEPIPGPSAILAALAVSGIDTETFTFLGFPPTKSNARIAWFDRLARASGAAVFFEAPHRIERTLQELLERVGDRQVLVGRELTKVHEQLVRGPISQVIKMLGEPRGEFTIVVEIGQLPDRAESDNPAATESRRRALAAVAQSHGLTANELYQAIVAVKKSVERPT